MHDWGCHPSSWGTKLCKGSLRAEQSFRHKPEMKSGSRIGFQQTAANSSSALMGRSPAKLCPKYPFGPCQDHKFQAFLLKNPFSKGSPTLTAVLGKSCVFIISTFTAIALKLHFGETFKGLYSPEFCHLPPKISVVPEMTQRRLQFNHLIKLSTILSL